MMKKITEILIDDIDGSEAARSVEFSFNGVSWEIDLSEKHFREMEEDFAKWEAKARRTGGRAKSKRPAAKGGNPDSARIREWAREQGIEVNERGRIPAKVLEQYRAAN